jgi:arylsulfatase A-like enzyme
MRRRSFAIIGLPVALALLMGCGGNDNGVPSPTATAVPPAATRVPPTATPTAGGTHPNIVFIIVDDAGIDKWSIFGYGGLTPPFTPNIDTLALGGVRFRNVWAMPECSASRASMFTGRYPLRTGVMSALTSADLANSQTSPFEITTPKVLQAAGYASALIGKSHLGGPEHNPLDNGVVHALGWDYYDGFMLGAPGLIDTTAGGVGQPHQYPCGFVQDARSGACYLDGGARCIAISAEVAETDSTFDPSPGRRCMEMGGILVPGGGGCLPTPPITLNFDTPNGYYAWPQVINDEQGNVSTRISRAYAPTQEVDAALAWLPRQPPGKPWMLTLSFATDHTPYQPPPRNLVPSSVYASRLDCSAGETQRILSNEMIEAMDQEIGRFLVQAGLARRTGPGTIEYHPRDSNTMIVLVTDNGSFLADVKAPFDPLRSKGTPYQAGVWVEMLAAGPLVHEQMIGREVDHQVNIADLFQLFAEIAGVDVRSVVPESHTLDAQSVLPYLTNPGQASIRQTNFSQLGIGHKAPGGGPWPCVISQNPLICVDVLFSTQSDCDLEQGEWYGPGTTLAPEPLQYCCDVHKQTGLDYLIPSRASYTTRNRDYKLVRKDIINCDTAQPQTVYEFYRVDQLPVLPKLDDDVSNLLSSPDLPPQFRVPTDSLTANFNALLTEMNGILSSEPDCPGDCNLDKVVNQDDIAAWSTFQGKGSSVCDLNFDARTDEADRTIIEENLGTECGAQHQPPAPMSRLRRRDGGKE